MRSLTLAVFAVLFGCFHLTLFSSSVFAAEPTDAVVSDAESNTRSDTDSSLDSSTSPSADSNPDSSIGSGINSSIDSSTGEYRLRVTPLQGNFDDLHLGQTYTGEFWIVNRGSISFDYTLEIAPYSVANTNYEPDFTSTSNRTELTNWLTILDATSGTLAPSKEKLIHYSFTVPANAPAGGQNAAILVSSIGSSGSSASAGVDIVRRIAYQVHGNVAGNTTVAATISENHFPAIILSPPLFATATVQNTGNTNLEATFILEVLEPFNSEKVIYSNASDTLTNTRTILPETERFNQNAWEDAPQLGLYRVRQTVTIAGQKSITEHLVLICPLWFALAIILFVGLVVYEIISHIIRHRRNNQRQQLM